MKVVIVAIAKMEQDYIEEWVKYNLHIGIDRIFLYDNGRKSTKGLTDSWWLHYTDAWKSILGAFARGV
jgi:hypothetical protein